MQPSIIKNDIHWVGAVDFESRNFHGYSQSPQGTSYNAYVLRDQKNVLFDTVKAESADLMLRRLSAVMPPEDIDYIVVNHLEADHAGALPAMIAACKPEKIFCSAMAFKTMERHFPRCGDWPVTAVTTGDSVNTGKRNIHFLEARMLHWPDSMFSYISEDKLLITNDAFGQNIACSERFADEIEPADLERLMREYYYNIVLPYSPQVLQVLDRIAALQWDVDMIAPDHGLIFRGPEAVGFALERYRAFAEQKPQKRALIVFDTMWGGTEQMAFAYYAGLIGAGVHTSIMNLKQNHHSAVMTELGRSGLFIAGCPTHNNGILPDMAGVLTYIKGLRPQNRIGAAFGAFGWSGESPKVLTEYLQAMHMELPVEPVKVRFRPTEDDLRACRDAGERLGQALIKKCGG